MQEDSNESKVPLCNCGCNQEVKWNNHSKRWNSILKGHNSPCKQPNICLCGCGNETKIGNMYCKGHFKHTGDKQRFTSLSFYGKTHSEESKKKLSDARMGHSWSEETRTKILATRAVIREAKKLTQPQKESIQCLCGCGEMTNPGAKHIRGHHNRNKSEETRRRISKGNTGKVGWRKGKTAKDEPSILAGDRHPRGMKGKKHSNKTKNQMSFTKALNVNGTPLDEWVRPEREVYDLIRKDIKYTDWRKSVYTRDGFICQKCFKTSGGDLNAHHIKRFNDILIENNITTLDEAYLCQELWDLNNGTTLCKECHKEEHKPNIQLAA